MNSSQAIDKTQKPTMNCMEIQGGSGSTNNHFSRPGVDIWLSSQSHSLAQRGGSDLYFVSSCASGRITRTLLADICSYGSDFTRTANVLRELMKMNINSIRQSRFVRQFSDQLADGSERGCFATVLLSTYFAPTRKYTLCNAGHAPPLLFRSKSGTWSLMKQTSKELTSVPSSHGVVVHDEYQQFETKLKDGDLVLSYSSAIAECRNQQGHTLGCQGLLERVSHFDPYQPAKLASKLTDSIRAEHPENLAEEDGTVMLCQATLNKVPWVDNVLAPLRYLKNASDKTLIGQ